MNKITSREIRLASRPQGIPTAANFTHAQVELKTLPDQTVLVRNLFMSGDPHMACSICPLMALTTLGLRHSEN